MSYIRLVGNDAAVAFWHLQVVFNGVREIEVRPSGVLSGIWKFDINTEFEEPGYFSPTESSDIDLGGRSADNVWALMVQAAESFASSDPIEYYPFSQNSNSFINTLLYSVGISAATYAPELPYVFPALGHNVIDHITFNISGTSGDDWFIAGAKNDILSGGSGQAIVSVRFGKGTENTRFPNPTCDT